MAGRKTTIGNKLESKLVYIFDLIFVSQFLKIKSKLVFIFDFIFVSQFLKSVIRA